jgi:hypothetical protein
MKTYVILAVRSQFLARYVEANSYEEAEQLAYETPMEKWLADGFGDVEHVDTKEIV